MVFQDWRTTVVAYDPARSESAARRSYDLIVVGGGVYGVAADASRRPGADCDPVLLERDDFGGATSWNSLASFTAGSAICRSSTCRRFRESVRANAAGSSASFPDLVRPCPASCRSTAKGLHRPASSAPPWPSTTCSPGGRNGVRDPTGTCHGAGDLAGGDDGRFPAVSSGEGLRGGGALVRRGHARLAAAHHGDAALGLRPRRTALNYVEARDWCRGASGRRASGARTASPDEKLEFRAPVVVNCAGPWCREVAARLRPGPSRICSAPRWRSTLLLDREPLSDAALAVAPPHPRAGPTSSSLEGAGSLPAPITPLERRSRRRPGRPPPCCGRS